MSVSGYIRIMSQSKYPNPVPTAEVIKRLQEGWSDEVMLLFWLNDLIVELSEFQRGFLPRERPRTL
jgi:hypothetical protein